MRPTAFMGNVCADIMIILLFQESMDNIHHSPSDNRDQQENVSQTK